jgi:hypothetical protein
MNNLVGKGLLKSLDRITFLAVKELLEESVKIGGSRKA